MEEWIDIAQVLLELEELTERGVPKVFSIAWVRAHNSSSGLRGSIKEVAYAMKFTDPTKRKKGPRRATSEGWKFKQYGTIPIQDVRANRLLTPKLTHILTFNEKKVRHYGKV